LPSLVAKEIRLCQTPASMRAGRFAGIFEIGLALTFCLFSGGCATRPTSSFSTRTVLPNARYDLCLGPQKIWFNPGQDTDLKRLARAAAAQAAAEKKLSKSSGPRLSSPERKYRRGLEQIARLADEARTATSPQERDVQTALLLETVAAVNNVQQPPIPSRMDFAETPAKLFRDLYRPVGRGQTQATDLATAARPDLSLIDPLPSSFWQRPTNIASQNLYNGFGRADRFELDDQLCEYSGPKDSFGMNPGFEVVCDGVEVKLKFAEIFSEPFTARIFDALGFHSDPTDQSRGVRVRYDRRIFQEFHSRQPLKTRFTGFGFVTLYTMDLQKHFDPFDYIATAVLSDGQRWTGTDLKRQLFRDPSRPHPEDDPDNYRPDVEARIAWLVTVPANIQPKDPLIKTIGSWDYGELDHPDRREVRGAGLLAAWLGFFDTRCDNNRLRTVQRGTKVELVHYFSDLGGGMGETSGLLFSHGERPNAFPWTFTLPALAQGSGHLARPLRIRGFKPITPNSAFEAMTIDDARWMARLIGQLTEQQLVQALLASGCDSATVCLYTEKLISRRDRMIADLGLTRDIPPLRPAGINRDFSYDPSADGPVGVDVPGHSLINAPIGKHRIIRGKLVPRPGGEPDKQLETQRRPP
jgi:hypothetical protein